MKKLLFILAIGKSNVAFTQEKGTILLSGASDLGVFALALADEIDTDKDRYHADVSADLRDGAA